MAKYHTNFIHAEPGLYVDGNHPCTVYYVRTIRIGKSRTTIFPAPGRGGTKTIHNDFNGQRRDRTDDLGVM